eukprot:1498397-Prymnesium_polylepis.1
MPSARPPGAPLCQMGEAVRVRRREKRRKSNSSSSSPPAADAYVTMLMPPSPPPVRAWRLPGPVSGRSGGG